MMKLIFLPFRVAFFLVRIFLFPWYLRWIFRMHWVVYFVFAAGFGYFAYQEYQTHIFKQQEARLQIVDAPPDVIPLSSWTTANNAPDNGEVRIRGLYFTALQTGEFDPTGLAREFILLADDQGREIKAVLVVLSQDMADLQRSLMAQGSGDRIPVTVNGSLKTSSEWDRLIDLQLRAMGIPAADDIVVVEPFIGNRADAIADDANKTFGGVVLFGAGAVFLAFIGTVKFLFGIGRRGVQSMVQARRNAQQVEHPVKTPQSATSHAASPWGTLQPVATAEPPTNDQPKGKATQRKPRGTTKKLSRQNAFPPQPVFKSVFPGGGSGFRYKSADEIILQKFGTLSTLTARKHDK